MDDSHHPNYQESFSVTSHGKDIPEARFNAWTALDVAKGTDPTHCWKLAAMQHGIEAKQNDEGELEPRVVCNATWIYDPNADGGKAVEEFAPEPTDPISV